MRENRLVVYSVVFIALVLLAIVLKTFQSVMRPLAIATLLVFIFTPLAEYSRRKSIPVWLTFTGLFIVVFLLLSQVGSLISTENLDLEKAIPQFQERIHQDSGGILALGSRFGLDLEGITPEKLSDLAGQAVKAGLAALRTVFSEALLALILMMFLIQSRPALFGAVERKYGGDEVARLKATFQKIEGDIIAYFGTKAAMSLGTAVLTGIVLWLFNAKFISVSLLIVFLLNFIPTIGSMIAVAIVLLLYLLTFGASASVAWLFILLMAVQILFGSILEPRIAGKRLNMSPILIILSLYVWGWIWGIIGMLLSVPFTIFILIILKHVGTRGKDRVTL